MMIKNKNMIATWLILIVWSGRCPTTCTPQGNDSCQDCYTRARHKDRTVYTMIYHTQQPPRCVSQGQRCMVNQTMYHMCRTGKKVQCYNPTVPERLNVTVYAGLYKTTGESKLYYLTHNTGLGGTEPLTLNFDVCAAARKVAEVSCGSDAWIRTYRANHKYLCERNLDWAKGNPNQFIPCGARTDCSGWKCVCDYTGGGYGGCTHISQLRRVAQSNNITFEVARDLRGMRSYGIGIDGTGTDPSTYITIKVEVLTEGEQQTLGWSVYDTLAKLEKNPLIISSTARNLFIELAEQVAKTLVVKNCFVCGGTGIGEQWPWEAQEAAPEMYNSMYRAGNITSRNKQVYTTWTLSTNLVGQQCFVRNGTTPVGNLMCLGQWDVAYQQ